MTLYAAAVARREKILGRELSGRECWAVSVIINDGYGASADDWEEALRIDIYAD